MMNEMMKEVGLAYIGAIFILAVISMLVA